MIFDMLAGIAKKNARENLLDHWAIALKKSLREIWHRNLCQGESIGTILYDLAVPEILRISSKGIWSNLTSRIKPIGEIVRDFVNNFSRNLF